MPSTVVVSIPERISMRFPVCLIALRDTTLLKVAFTNIGCVRLQTIFLMRFTSTIKRNFELCQTVRRG
jgi:hypothetical protein